MLAISMLLAGHALLTRPAGMSELAAHRRASTSIAETAALYAGDEHAAKLAVAERWAAGFARLIADERLAPAADSRWQREPFVSRALAPLAVGFFTATHLAAAVERNFLDAGLGSFDARGRAGWQVGRVGTPRGHSFEEAKMLWSEVEEALARGTVVFNSFGAHEPALAELCLGAVHAFGLPANLNLYITKAGMPLSAPPHTDKQDVLVIQTQGVKRWRVFAPPEPAAKPTVDPYARGKAADRLELTELGPALLELELSPGDALYIPAGYPHTTSTPDGGGAAGGARAAAEPSVHLTLNIDSHIWALTYDGARRLALGRAAATGAGGAAAEAVRAATRAPLSLALPRFLAWHDTIPIGFQSGRPVESGAAADAADARAVEALAGQLAARLCAAAPDAWPPGAAGEAAAAAELALGDCAARQLAHARALLDTQRRLYLDAALELTPTAHGVSLFRVRPYMDELETAMAELASWAGLPAGALAGGGALTTSAPTSAGPVAAPVAKSKRGASKGKGGFGS